MGKMTEKELADLITGSYEKHMLSAGLSEEKVFLIHIKVAADIIKAMASL